MSRAAALRSRRRRDAAASVRTWSDPHVAPPIEEAAFWGLATGPGSPEPTVAGAFDAAWPWVLPDLAESDPAQS